MSDRSLNRCRSCAPVNEEFSIRADSKGVYVLVMELNQPARIRSGKIPEAKFQQGSYLYVGRAKKHLRARLLRHLRKEKTLFWHIDYFLQKAEIKKIWVKLNFFDECQTRKKIQGYIGKDCMSIPGFGSSDCGCSSHLIYLSEGETPRDGICRKIGFTEAKIDENCL